jgi:chitodextrinase
VRFVDYFDVFNDEIKVAPKFEMDLTYECIMKRLALLTLLVISCAAMAQNGNSLWKIGTTTNKARMAGSADLPQKKVYDLNLTALQNALTNSPKRQANGPTSGKVISLPNAEGMLENFAVYENPVMEDALAAAYPEIKSYVAIGIDNPNARAYFSNSPLGFRSMTLYPDKSAVFIEPLSADLITYTVYQKSDKLTSLDGFECGVIDKAVNGVNNTSFLARPNADDAKLRTFRLALSCTGEYATYFGGTKALALAGMNNTMTRCNAIFESDFGLRLVMIATNDAVIYTAATSDPYADATSMSSWNAQLQATLTAVIGEANYDIGHLLGATGGGGNAGCIGCVCVNGSKGKGYTSPSSGIPAGDNFDIDYVAHEMGHQLGANHTYTHVTESGTGAQMEPGSGSTIMSYAGITTKDIQRHSDPYFHAISIQQVTNNIKAKTCPTLTSTGNAIPVVNAGLDYTIPKGTPFMLTGTASDANGDALTYAWEEMDLGTATTAAPLATAISGPIFRSYLPTTSSTRYFPRMATVLSGQTTTAGTEIPWEVLPGVARTLNFRLTVRDNRVGGPANNSDDVIVSVNGIAGPFAISSPNMAISYTGGTTQTITWNVAGTTANGVNCANVDILLSTDGGQTFTTTLISGTANDGSQSVVIPNIAGTANRIMIKGNNHIFFDVSDSNFTITTGSTVIADIIAPSLITSLLATGTTTTSTNLSWKSATDNVGTVGYDVYQNGIYKTTTSNTNLAITGLASASVYTFYVIAKDAAGNASLSSNVAIATTLSLDLLAPGTSTLSASGTTTTTTNLSWSSATDNVGVVTYEVYQNGGYKTTTTATVLAVPGLTASTSYNFYVKAKDAAGNASAASNTVSITTATNGIAYCTAKGKSSAREYINKFQLGTINNLSGNNSGYGNFISQSTNLAKGSSNTMSIVPAWTNAVYAECYAVWIDFNQDGDFTDSGEQVINQSKTKATPINGTITIPSTALLGTTRLRVAMKLYVAPTACESFAYGEVEDYTVNITAAGRVEEEVPTALAFKVYPNPVTDILNIADIDSKVTFRIYNMMGQQLIMDNLDNNSIYVGSLAAGHYLIEISDGITTSAKHFIKQ